MSSVELSVIVPLYNKEPYIAAAIQSVLNQKHLPTQIIVVDNNSTDGSLEIVKGFGDKVLLASNPVQGEGATRNYGLALAQTEWVALLDADDFWLPNHLMLLAQLIEKFGQSVVVGTSSQNWDGVDPSRFPHRNLDSAGEQLDYFGMANVAKLPFNSSSVALRRKIALDLGGFSNIRNGADLCMWVHLASVGSFAWTPEVTSLYRQVSSGLSGTFHQAKANPELCICPSISVVEKLLAARKLAPNESVHRYVMSRKIVSIRCLLRRGERDAARKLLAEVRSAPLKWRLPLQVALLVPSGPLNLFLPLVVNLKTKLKSIPFFLKFVR